MHGKSCTSANRVPGFTVAPALSLTDPSSLSPSAIRHVSYPLHRRISGHQTKHNVTAIKHPNRPPVSNRHVPPFQKTKHDRGRSAPSQPMPTPCVKNSNPLGWRTPTERTRRSVLVAPQPIKTKDNQLQLVKPSPLHQGGQVKTQPKPITN